MRTSLLLTSLTVIVSSTGLVVDPAVDHGHAVLPGESRLGRAVRGLGGGVGAVGAGAAVGAVTVLPAHVVAAGVHAGRTPGLGGLGTGALLLIKLNQLIN